MVVLDNNDADNEDGFFFTSAADSAAAAAADADVEVVRLELLLLRFISS